MFDAQYKRFEETPQIAASDGSYTASNASVRGRPGRGVEWTRAPTIDIFNGLLEVLQQLLLLRLVVRVGDQAVVAQFLQHSQLFFQWGDLAGSPLSPGRG
jgi:hypothetical protein